jgi:hypothetical protein
MSGQEKGAKALQVVKGLSAYCSVEFESICVLSEPEKLGLSRREWRSSSQDR